MRSIAIIDTNHTLSSMVLELRAEGLNPIVVNPRDSHEVLASRPFALVILDLAAVSDPVEFCRTAAERQAVIAVSPNGNADTFAQILEAGADDCVPRSISARELIARIRNILWRSLDHSGPDLEPVQTMQIRVGSTTVDLSHGEAEVLALLVEHAPAPLTIDQILALLRSSPRVKRATVASRLKSLRRKLRPGCIEVRPGFGYQLVISPK